jgi:hypothetical protein
MTLAVISPKADRVVVAFVTFALVGNKGIRLAPADGAALTDLSLSAFSSCTLTRCAPAPRNLDGGCG